MNIATVTPFAITGTSAKSGGTISGVVENYFPIVNRLLMNKFQLQKTSCQKFTGSVRSLNSMKPFQMFQEEKQGEKKFLLTGFTFHPMSDEYEVQLNEYDNTTEITLNIVP